MCCCVVRFGIETRALALRWFIANSYAVCFVLYKFSTWNLLISKAYRTCLAWFETERDRDGENDDFFAKFFFESYNMFVWVLWCLYISHSAHLSQIYGKIHFPAFNWRRRNSTEQKKKNMVEFMNYDWAFNVIV